MNYTGTRFSTTLQDGWNQLLQTDSSAQFVSSRLSDQSAGAAATYSNAGGWADNTLSTQCVFVHV